MPVEIIADGEELLPVVAVLQHVVKPDPRMFQILLKRYALDSRTTLFIDDNRLNVETAGGLGFHVHLFQTPQGLQTALAGHGLL